MQPSRFNHSITRGAAAAVIGVVSFLAACEARMPTSSDINRMDGAAVQRVSSLTGVIPDSSVAWLVDGVPSTASAAKQIPAEKLASVDIKKVDGKPIISLRTKSGVGMATTADTTPAKRVGFPVGAEPMVILDGAPSSVSALSSLSRDRIERVEVIKGESAMAQYGASGKNGVILVTTKKGDGSQP